jgi:hypothetical protein
MGAIVVGTTPGKQQLHLEHLVRGHQSGTVPAPGDNCGGHHSRKAATAPGTLEHQSGTVSAPGVGGGGDDSGHHSGKAAPAASGSD